MIPKTLKKVFAWLLTFPCKKGSSGYIKMVSGKGRIISFNKKKIYFSDIKEINSDTEKNYSKLITFSDKAVYYYNDSIDNLIKIASEPFIRINKRTAVNYNYITERLNNAYVFVEGTPYEIGDGYRQSVEDFFSDMESRQL